MSTRMLNLVNPDENPVLDKTQWKRENPAVEKDVYSTCTGL